MRLTIGLLMLSIALLFSSESLAQGKNKSRWIPGTYVCV